VYSYSISHFSVEPAWKPLLPYAVIVAELAEGPRVIALARGMAPGDVHIGMPVRITTERRSDEFALFWAEKA